MGKKQKGFALVLVIWILALLSLMAGSYVMSMRRELAVATALTANAQAAALAESWLTLAEYMLQQPDQERRWLANGAIYQIFRIDGSEIRVSIVSEAGKIDINAANETLLSTAIDAVTADKWEQQKLLNSILDWRDEDNEPRMRGAEAKQYLEAGLSYQPSNRPFQTVGELELVLGVDESVFNRMRPWLTVYSGRSDVDLNEATPEVLQLLGDSLSNANMDSQPTQQAAAGNQQAAPNMGGNTNNQNQTYTITVQVRMVDGASAALEAVVKMNAQNSGSQYEVLDWRQNQLTQSLFAYDMDSGFITIQDEFTNDY